MKKIALVLSIFSFWYLCSMDNPKKEKSRITLSFSKDKEKKTLSEDISRKNSPSTGNTTPSSAERRLSSLEEAKNAYQERKKQSAEPQLPK